MVTRRRGWGEGGVYRRQSDRMWVGTVELGRDHRGRRRRQALYARTKREVLEKLEKARRDKGQGLEPLDQRLTVGEWLDTWLLEHTGDLSPGSLATYRNGVESYVRPEVGHLRLATLSPADVERMGRTLRDRGLSATPRSSPTGFSGPSLSVAERHGIVHRNVAAIAAGPRRDDRAKTDDTLSPAEAEAVITAASGDRLEALASLLLTLGLRKGEALALASITVARLLEERTRSGDAPSRSGFGLTGCGREVVSGKGCSTQC